MLRSLPPGWPAPPTVHDRLRVETLFKTLISCPAPRRRQLIEENRSCWSWLFAVRLCQASEEAAADAPGEARELAELALLVAGHVAGPEGFELRLAGYCMAAVANARRVGNDMLAAGETFAEALSLWHRGKDDAGLLPEARMLDLEASLRRDQRLFEPALKLHREALDAASPEEIGYILLNKSSTLQHKGNHEEALAVLQEAAGEIDGERQPRLRCVLRFNQAVSLTRLQRVVEAEPLLREVKELAERLGKDLDLLRTRWLEANVAAGLGRLPEALEGLEQVRRGFEKRNLPYDHALASLDMALLYRQEERFGEIKTLAAEMLAIFEAQRVHREALASILLFQEAAEKEAVTPEMVHRLQEYLAKAKGDPKLRFEA